MALYPSLEDMKVDQLAKAQIRELSEEHYQIPSHPNPHMQNPSSMPAYPPQPTSMPSYPPQPTSMPAYPPQPSSMPAYPPVPDSTSNSNPQTQAGALYPTLTEYMGLDLTPQFLAQHMPYKQETHSAPPTPSQEVAIPPPNQLGIPRTTSGWIAPLSGSSLGLKKAEVTHGIREVVLCKDGNGKLGLRVKDVSKGVFVALVQKDSPAAMVGLRFGDQILQINGENVAGYNVSKVHDLIKRLPDSQITMAVRDRPFERTITLHKDSHGHIGFGYKEGKISFIVKDSSAARNGLLIDHHLLEVNGQNVVGLKDRDITAIIDQGGNILTITIMPSFLYDHMIKHMRSSLIKNLMDHSIPDL